MIKRFLAAAIAATLTLVASMALAYEVSPLRIFMSPSAGRSAATIAVNNSGSEELLFEVKILKRVVARDGTQTLEAAPDAFTIFPPQARVAPAKSQAVRIQYAGPPVVDQSASYIVQIAEVPVMKPGFSGVRFAYNFGVAVYVDPPRARPMLVVENQQTAEGKLRFSVRNDGNGYGFVSGYSLKYVIGGKEVIIPPATLETLIASPIVPPNSTRDFELDIEGIVAGQAAAVTLDDQKL